MAEAQADGIQAGPSPWAFFPGKYCCFVVVDYFYSETKDARVWFYCCVSALCLHSRTSTRLEINLSLAGGAGQNQPDLIQPPGAGANNTDVARPNVRDPLEPNFGNPPAPRSADDDLLDDVHLDDNAQAAGVSWQVLPIPLCPFCL